MEVLSGKIYRAIALGCVLLTAASCGSGSGDGDSSFIGAAVVSISTSPKVIDTGDRTKVQVTIDDVHPDGIALKIFYPHGLEYVENSAVLKIDDSTVNVPPAVNRSAGSTLRSGTYLVFFFPANLFSEGRGILNFELEASDIVQRGEIAVDADVDDPLIENPGEFDIENPEFGAEDAVEISVRN